MAILKIRNENGEMVPVPAIVGARGAKGDKGDKGEQGKQGLSGVYVGSGDMPEGYNVQIDPDGEDDIPVTKKYVDDLFNSIINGNEVAY